MAICWCLLAIFWRGLSELGLDQVRLETAAQAALLDYHWPGNVRELEHCIRRSVLHAMRRPRTRQQTLGITAEDLKLAHTLPSVPRQITGQAVSDAASASAVSDNFSLNDQVDQFKRTLIMQTLQAHDHNIASSARALHVDRSNLLRLSRRLGVLTF
jgi:anaerobic nitric oxide reductase transcription regulator